MGFLTWHYTQGFTRALNGVDFFIQSIFHNFSLPILIRSLFAPWKRMAVEDNLPGFNLTRSLENLTFNLISRSIGLVVRTILIFTCLICVVIGTLGGLLYLMLWLLLPPLGFWSHLQFQKRHELFIAKLKARLTINTDFAPTLLSNEAGQFLATRLNLSVAELIKNANPKVKVGVLKTSSFEEIIKKSLEEKLWSDTFLRQANITHEDIILAASWWDADKIKKTQKSKVYFSRPGIGLSLLFGYTPTLDQYTTDLSMDQSYTKHLVGREKVVGVIERALSAKNSVALVGAPGVGKKTVVLEFARKAAEGVLGVAMSYRRILEFDYNSLLAGSPDVNDKKLKLSAVLEEAKRAGNIVLVVRDLQRLTNAGVEGVDFTDVFEKYLESGEVKLISITTTVDFERFINGNARLVKHLEKVEVTPPTRDEALIILRDYADEWEKTFKVTVTAQALRKTLTGSDRYIADIPFPEKAIDLLDLVLEKKKLEGSNIVLPADVDAVLSDKTGISLARLTEREKDVLSNLESVIHESLINQESAVNLIAKSLRSRTLGLSKEDRPIGSFLFLGPTGVGKTETAKVLAKVYYGSTESILRFDMAQYSGQDALERLIGSTTTGRQGDLSVAIKNRPASLLLLDEIEKASKDALNLLLTVLDEGYLIDAFGRRINCQHLFIIGTSNAAAEYIRQLVQKRENSTELQKRVVEYVLQKGLFFPEFLNRFDGVVVYEPLSEDNLFKVARMMLTTFSKNLQSKGISLTVDDELIKQVVKDDYDPAFGARPMRRVVDIELGDLLGREILLSKLKEGDNIKIIYEAGKYKVAKI